jgi:hypothetical protein
LATETAKGALEFVDMSECMIFEKLSRRIELEAVGTLKTSLLKWENIFKLDNSIMLGTYG